MKKLPKINRSFYKLSDLKFNQLSQGVIESLTDNDFFPDIAPELTVFKTAYDKYFNSIPPRNIRNSVNTAIKNTNKEAAIQALVKLSFMVAFYADFEMEALESSGFELANKPQAKGQVGMVRDIDMKTNGVEGMVIIQCKRDENATTYKARVSTDQVNWLWVNASSNRTVKVHNIPVGVPVFVQMQLENAHGFSPWSDSVTGMIATQNLIASLHE
ncbi:MAG: hypothetical protein AB8H03_04760 [Saprospiraceae bacterium]